MANEKQNFILGRGEILAKPIPYQNRDTRSDPDYSWGEQIAHLSKCFGKQKKELEKIDLGACPNNQAVSMLTLHPRYQSRSGFPALLLKAFDLRLIGSRPVNVKPRKGRGSERDEGTESTALYLAGDVSSLLAMSDSLGDISEEDDVAQDILKVEDIELFKPEQRLHGKISKDDEELEVIVHFDSYYDMDWEDQFLEFAKRSGVQIDLKHNYQSRGLWFMPGLGGKQAAKKLAEFSFVRAIRPMPKLRILESPSVIRAVGNSKKIKIEHSDVVDERFRVAVFDGGVHGKHPFGDLVEIIEPDAKDEIGAPIDELLDHGTAVTSAVLFGHVDNEADIKKPYCRVDHYRVLGTKTTDRHLYNVMLYVDKILAQTNYMFTTFSFGPAEVAGDDLVTAWTSMLDDHLSEADCLATIAVGNDGDRSWPNNRIMIPSDCVNAIAVGASNTIGSDWERAEYSCVGPGRHPGTVKPDVVHFGGVDEEKFKFVYSSSAFAEDCGTSYATPAVIRVAAGLRAHFGDELKPLSIRALLLHCAENNGNPRAEVGWGRVPTDLDEITVCPDGTVRVLYQGKLEPGKVLRAPIPVPDMQLTGDVTIKATFCYVCATDPHVPGDYTRAGLDITFRPHADKYDKKPEYPKPDSFFKRDARSNEQELRADAHKWETVVSAGVNKRGSSLKEPVMDVHYLAREPGNPGSPSSAVKLPYALVITVSSKKHKNLYDLVYSRHKNKLSIIRPKIELPLRIKS